MLKQTIIDKAKEVLNIPIKETPLDSSPSTKHKYLFKEYGETHRVIILIDYRTYDEFEEIIPPKESIEIGSTVEIHGVKYTVTNYTKENGICCLDDEVENLSELNSEIYISNAINGDYVLVTVPYCYSKRLNQNVHWWYDRVQFDIYVYEDLNRHKTKEYLDKLGRLFSHDIKIQNNDYGFIEMPLAFKEVENNISNCIVRGSMLIRTLKK